MKLVIEVDQATENGNPTITVKVDDKPIGVIESIEFLAKANEVRPKCMIRFPDLNKVLGPHAPAEAKAALAPIIQSVAQGKKTLGFFRWIDLP